MNRRIYKLLIGFLVAIPLLLLSGCADVDKVYDMASEFEATDEELKILSEGKATLVYDKGQFDSTYDYVRYCAAVYVSEGSNRIKEHAVGIIIFCVVFGVLLHYISGTSIFLKRWAWIIGLGGTILVFVAVWGSALLADWFA